MNTFRLPFVFYLHKIETLEKSTITESTIQGKQNNNENSVC